MGAGNQTSSRKLTHVAVAVIRGDDGRILIAKRPDDKHMGGYWEFPGGKVEQGEDVKTALNRELKEELDIEAGHFQKLITIKHDYPGKTVLLDTWWATSISGTPVGNEGQELRWIETAELGSVEFPPANAPIVNAIHLPTQYMVTGQFSSAAELMEKVSLRLDSGIKLIQFRAPWLKIEHYQHLARELHHMCQEYGARLILKGKPEMLAEPWCDGVHLRSDQLAVAGKEWVESKRADQWLAASCHNQEQIDQAIKAGIDFVTLSPVRPTRSHPGRMAIGLDDSVRLTLNCPLPVYWLGGMAQEDQALAINNGAQGISAIGAFWAPKR